MIDVHGLTYFYPQAERPALCDLSWRARAGDFVLLAGASGSGKSTLLHCLSGLATLPAQGNRIAGQIWVNGRNALAAGAQRVSDLIGFVPQCPDLGNLATPVEEIIARALANQPLSSPARRIRLEEVLELLALTRLRLRPLLTLSGGERQRLAVATALVSRPSLLILDEPTSQLDPQAAEELLRALVRLNEDLGLTIILAEHRLERVLPYTDRVLYLEQGRVLVDAPARRAVPLMPQLPPVVELGRSLSWQPLPLTVKEAGRFRHQLELTKGKQQTHGRDLPAPPPNNGPARANRPANSERSPLLEVTNLSFAYNGRPTLKQINLQVAPGEVLALMGRNGAGKSTLLKCVAGLLTISAGEIRVNGQTAHDCPTAGITPAIGYLPQNLERLFEAPLHLSVGQRQRLALEEIASQQPQLLLLDEPTRGLDYQAKQALVALWRRWLVAGMGLLLVTHDVELAAQIADRVAIMSQGEIIVTGKAPEVLSATPSFAPQIARLFPNRGWLTVQDVLPAVKNGAGGYQNATARLPAPLPEPAGIHGCWSAD